MRPWLGAARSLEQLNALAASAKITTESGKPLRFVPPGVDDPYYETGVYESGRVAPRPENLHDWFNALAWLAFPRTKARINALHADELRRSPPHAQGRRGPLRDLLTIFDEGGAIVVCTDAELLALLKGAAWQPLFRDNRERVLRAMRIVVLGHAVLEQAIEPRPGITCKSIVLPGGDLDAGAAQWLADAPAGTSPKALLPLPVFGYPGWYPGQDAAFYENKRHFRP
ncbi:MAG: hypothetical protein QOD26_1939 [Betaproteobacteria bacterium]|nr:hypothetical protein [Betaproteobacteria bacterium]